MECQMTETAEYSKYRPKPYNERMPIFWWLSRWPHIRFITRELTSLWVAFFAVMLLLEVQALLQGPEQFENFLEWLRSPLSVALHSIALVFLLFHSITWFNLAPKALVIRLGSKRIPGVIIAALNYSAWLTVSALIAWIVLRG